MRDITLAHPPSLCTECFVAGPGDIANGQVTGYRVGLGISFKYESGE